MRTVQVASSRFMAVCATILLCTITWFLIPEGLLALKIFSIIPVAYITFVSGFARVVISEEGVVRSRAFPFKKRTIKKEEISLAELYANTFGQQFGSVRVVYLNNGKKRSFVVELHNSCQFYNVYLLFLNLPDGKLIVRGDRAENIIENMTLKQKGQWCDE